MLPSKDGLYAKLCILTRRTRRLVEGFDPARDYTPKLEPHEHVLVAFGFLILNPRLRRSVS